MAALIALVAVLVSVAGLGADRVEPERSIASPAQAFAASTMYVSPGEYGRPNGGDDENPEDAEEDARQYEDEPGKIGGFGCATGKVRIICGWGFVIFFFFKLSVVC